ncbi:hypothetical protein [Rhodopila globiformis]|nr:hypothetical protein [Rhodopila globiformis]
MDRQYKMIRFKALRGTPRLLAVEHLAGDRTANLAVRFDTSVKT